MRFMRHAIVTLCVVLSYSSYAQTRYERVVANMNQIAAQNPNLVQTFSIGDNDQGKAIIGLKIGTAATNGATKPNHLVVATHHGNEGLSVDVAMQFIKELLAAHQNPASSYHAMADGAMFYIIPVLNVSGYNANRREESSRFGNTLDSNRDYPDPCGTDETLQLASTRHLAEFIDAQQIIGAVTIHGYIGVFTYPWGTYTTQSHTLDHATFNSMAQQAIAVNHYGTGTHGDAIYPTVGAFEDWAYYEHGIWVMLLEIANNPNVQKDAQALMTYFTKVPAQRSIQHTHTGRCRVVAKSAIKARP